MASSITRILSLKTLLIATGVVSIAMVMKFSVPLIMYFAVYEVPVIWSIVLSWLKPPYLYIVINGIIITIAASSRFHRKLDDDDHSEPLVQAKAPPSDLAPVSSQPEFGVLDSLVVYESDVPILDVKPVVVNGSEVVGDEDEDEFVISRSTWIPSQRINSPETQTKCHSPPREKPLVSTRVGHRKPVKPSPEGGRALRVAKPNRHETLENTWKLITDGRHVPLTRHLRKSETWENHGRQLNADQPFQNVLKSETFKDRTNYDPPASSVGSSPGSGKLRKEASPSQDELNRRVEAFIKKFNEEMRLQRQESLNQYMEMINHGAH